MEPLALAVRVTFVPDATSPLDGEADKLSFSLLADVPVASVTARIGNPIARTRACKDGETLLPELAINNDIPL